jgi:hypothetical protein
MIGSLGYTETLIEVDKTIYTIQQLYRRVRTREAVELASADEIITPEEKKYILFRLDILGIE